MQSFIVSKAQRAIVLNPANPAMLRNLLPMAKPVPFRGQTLYAVPHDVDVVRLLRNVGVSAPSPILYQYGWPCAFPGGPFEKQKFAAAFLTLHPRAFNLSQMGTGKSVTTLWAFDYLRSIGKRHRMLVVAPLSTLERTWGDEIFTHFPHLEFCVLHGTAARRRKLLTHRADVYIINHDGIGVIAKELAGREDIDVIAIDEIAVYRNATTDRYKAIEGLCAPVDRVVWGLTGMPIPNEPTDAWAQVKLVNPGRVPRYFGQFREQTMIKVTPYKYAARKGALDTVREAMQPAIRFTREELPPTRPEMRHVELSAEQKRAYDDIRLRLKTEAEEGTIRAVNEADKLMKLVQVAAGAAYDVDGNPVILENNARISETMSIIEQADGKVIVFVPFIAALHNLHAAIAERYPAELVYGGTSKAERDAAFWRFQHLSKEQSHVLVANAAAMSHGLTLTEANVVVWFAPTVSHETFDQANHRIIRPGQEYDTFIVMLEGTKVERDIYARIQQRQSMQGLLLESVGTAGY